MCMLIYRRKNKITGMLHLEVTLRKFISCQSLVLG